MADNLTKEQRSKIMSRIRSKWTKQEIRFHNYLKGNKIKHTMHPKMIGSPDVILPTKKVAIFIHGCFWHGCKYCYRPPKSNKKFWRLKVESNIKRDIKNKKLLKKSGWRVVTIWEHEIDPKTIKKLKFGQLKRKILK